MYDYKLMLLERGRRYKRKRKLKRILLSLLYLFILTLAGLGFNTSYAVFSTYARTPPGSGDTVEAKDILEVKGNFDADKWLKSEYGESGFVIKNASTTKICVFFSIEGSLQDAVQHINPVSLRPGESCDIPVRLAGVSELGLLEWRNNNRVFEGRIIARVLNDYAAYEIGTIALKGKDLYEKAVSDRDDPEGRITAIKSVKDILKLCAEILELTIERDRLREEVDRLNEVNRELREENSRLRDMVDSLEGTVDSLRESLDGAGQLIDELKPQPQEQQPGPEEKKETPIPQTPPSNEAPPGQTPETASAQPDVQQ
ncbi:MAG TPA: hypothetical protein GXX19_00285 [Syntrophomonadaceae bacterium]|nr:hypothetical protein [Syntrophomonadaceae bacterium]